MFISFFMKDAALQGLAFKTRAHEQSNNVTAPLFCTAIRRVFFYVTSFLHDVISMFYTKRHKDPFLMGAII